MQRSNIYQNSWGEPEEHISITCTYGYTDTKIIEIIVNHPKLIEGIKNGYYKLSNVRREHHRYLTGDSTRLERISNADPNRFPLVLEKCSKLRVDQKKIAIIIHIQEKHMDENSDGFLFENLVYKKIFIFFLSLSL